MNSYHSRVTQEMTRTIEMAATSIVIYGHHFMSGASNTCMGSARAVVLREWNRRRTVQLDTGGGWHICNRMVCPILNLCENVCVGGEHIVSGAVCASHPQSAVLRVTDVYVCRKVGNAHVCDQTTCPTEAGKCTISGRCCVASSRTSLTLPLTNKRCRRRPCSVHTNEQAACILLYNLLFSKRRVSSEIQRARTTLEIARRQAQRVAKSALRDQVLLRYSELVDIYMIARQRMCYTKYLFICDSDTVRRDICMYYAAIAVSVWNTLLASLPVRSTFECTCAALVYAMRKGVAYDGMYAIPPDRFLAYALPDAHAIKDVDISRRSLTQARNSLYSAVQACISSGTVPVEQFAFKFKSEIVPEVLARHFPNND